MPVDLREESFREGFRAGVAHARSAMLDAVYAMREPAKDEDDAWRMSATKLEQTQERHR